MRAPLALAILFVAWPAPGAAQERAEAAIDAGDPRVELELLADAEAVAPGASLRVGVRFRMDPGWHVYWRNPGESGVPTEVRFAGLEGLGEPPWPAPHRFVAPGPIVTYGYGGEVLFATEGRVRADATGELELEATADFLVCEVDCIPDRVTLRRVLPVAAETRRVHQAAFDAAEAARPVAPEALGLELELVAGAAPAVGETAPMALGVVQGHGPGEEDACPALAAPEEGAEAALLPGPMNDAVRVEELRVAPHPSAHAGLALRFDAALGPNALPERFDAVLHLRRGGEDVHLRVDLPLPSARAEARALLAAPGAPSGEGAPGAADATDAPAPERPGWLLALALGLLGGLLLNLMPCVLPVLSVKVFGLLHAADEGEAGLKRHGLAYLAGVLAAMGALAAVVLALRAAGVEVGMGFQLQEPRFVALLAALLVLLAMSFFGVFELRIAATGLSRRVDASHGWLRSAGEGVLTVILATPCSAPFLGTAVGFAFAGGAASILAVFGAIGVGLALPFLVLARFPALVAKLPRPGPWMEKLQRVLGFALLGTAAWLAWVHAQLTGVLAQGLLLGFLLAVAFGTWMAASFRAPLARALAAAIVLGGGALVWGAPVAGEAGDAEVAELGAWRPWSEEAVRAEVDAGRTAFVVFTADWCVTCKVNEQLVLSDEAVRARLAEDAVTPFVADWTRRDERIRAELARHGKAGVPLYLVFRPGQRQPEVLPELLTPARVIEALGPRRSG